MKKTIIASMLSILSLGASANYYSNSHDRESKLDVSYASYDSESDNLELNNESGVLVNYQYNGNDNDLMVRASVEGFKVLDETLLFGQVGIGYDLPLDLERFVFTPEIGLYYVDGAENDGAKFDDKGFYFGGSVTAEIIPETLDGVIYYRKVDFDQGSGDKLLDDLFDDNFMGIKLSYEFDKDVTLEAGYEKSGDLDRLNLGIGYKF